MCGEAARPPVYLISSFVILSIVLKCATARARLGRRSKGGELEGSCVYAAHPPATVIRVRSGQCGGRRARAREAASD